MVIAVWSFHGEVNTQKVNDKKAVVRRCTVIGLSVSAMKFPFHFMYFEWIKLSENSTSHLNDFYDFYHFCKCL